MLSVERPGFNPTESQLGFVVDKVAVGQITLKHSHFPPPCCELI